MEYVVTFSKIGLTLAVVLVLSLLTMITLRTMGIDIKDIKQRTNSNFLAICSISNLLVMATVAWMSIELDKKSIKALGFHIIPKDIWFVLMSIAITFLVAVGYVYAIQLKGIIKATWIQDVAFSYKEAISFLFALVVLGIVALQEEVVFRAYFSIQLSQYGFFAAVFLSSTLFTIWHFLTNKVNALQVLDWFVGGVSLYIVFVLTGSVWVAAGLHFARNLMNVLVFNIAQSHALITFNKPIPASFKSIYTLLVSCTWILLVYMVYHV